MNKFIEKAVLEILAGIEEFNRQDLKYKAFAPEEIQFDVAAEGSSRVKFTVNVAHYKHLKQKENNERVFG